MVPAEKPVEEVEEEAPVEEAAVEEEAGVEEAEVAVVAAAR